MHAEIISIGDELTSGERLDTNSQWLSQQLGQLGIRVMFHTTIADDMKRSIPTLALVPILSFVLCKAYQFSFRASSELLDLFAIDWDLKK